jgi:Sigma-54 interaction domain
MAQSSRLAGRVDRFPAHRSFAPRPDGQQHGAEPLISDEDLARHTRLNLLVMGADDVVTRFLASLWPYFLTPRVVHRRGQALRLMPTSRPVGTILLYDVDTLTHREQRALYRWIVVGNGRTRIVSTTTQSLQPLLEKGAFDADLYYRLNVLTLDLTSPVAH